MKNKSDVYKNNTVDKNRNTGAGGPLSPADTDDVKPPQRKKSSGSSSAPGEGPNPTAVEGDVD